MHYSHIKFIVDKKIVKIDKGSLKTKRKFAFLLDIGEIILRNDKKEYNVYDEIDVVEYYTYTENSKRPKEDITIYKIKDIKRY